jgi:small subunit ribosomal protein S5
MPKPAGRRKFSRKREPKEFDEQVIQIDRVTRVVKGGRKLRFRATVAIGNRKGKVGIGIGKSHEVTGAIQKAIAKAKKDMIVAKLDGSTIPHEVNIKFKAAKILLLPASPGTGLIAGGTIRKVLDLAGVKDVLSKSFGTTNKVNTTKAAFEALRSLQSTPGMERRAAKNAQIRAANKQAPKKEAPKSEKKPQSKKSEAPKATEKPAAKKPEAKKETTTKE